MERHDIYDEASFQTSLLHVKRNLTEVGFDSVQSARFLTAVSELARNILKYAERGVIEIKPHITYKQHGVEVKAIDYGPGIADIDKAMQERFSSSGTLGQGLPGAKRLVDEFAIESSPVGTSVTLKSWC